MAKAERNTNIFHLLRIGKGLSIKELAEQLSITPAYMLSKTAKSFRRTDS